MDSSKKETGIFDAPYRALTIGIILAVTTVAFEGLAITTIAPSLAQKLQGLHLYGWIFSAFLLAQIVGTMVTGQRINKKGVFASFITSILFFVIGIVVAALSVNMLMLIAGRLLQGFGAGAIITCVYFSITVGYPDRLRTKILAMFSSAYILPALIGPYIAGLLAEYISWRFVFWFVLPFIGLAVVLTLPAFRNFKTEGASESKKSRKEGYAVLLAVGTGMLLAGIGSITNWKGIALTAAGVLIMILPLRKLLPAGTFSAGRGLPSTIISRGLFVACYNATESYVVLALTDVKKLPADLAGLIVAAGALSWSAAAWFQSKLDAKDQGTGRNKRVTAGIGLMVIGVIAVMLAVSLPEGGIVYAVISQVFTGFGIGLAHPTTGAIALQHANRGEEGEISANLQFTDAFSPGLSIGIGGAFIAISQTMNWGLLTGIMLALSLQLLFVIWSLAMSFRIKKGMSSQA
ncbi:MFS transporter [Paenibacillus radicis (ex Gao et al. 2016)]|uniref:MFS transporter n=1 Tax=Paenibacillus radicis (ex Gao et al. 2016) TaxID=1737354 RepID=A0A917M322_9BACL|nr:MFS transporter [Paenibacillus radicis (ex Gao et al. 2016)]GGG76073.1 MFS transporter [Paenibacillus radicis (ex Gao et al. 2016)]